MISSTSSKAFPPGIHVPSLTFFRDDARQEIDWDVQEKHLNFLVASGLHGIVLAGTNGEAITLTSAEKIRLVQRTKAIAHKLGRSDIPVVMGCVAGCTRDVIDQTIEAKNAGADFALVLVPSYFHFAMDQEAIISFFQELADTSPIPILIYNFPGVVAGLDVSSEMLDILGRHKNIVGVKLTCGGIAKVTRVSASFSPDKFCALAGQSDWLIPALSVGGTGCITGVANLYPKACVELYNLYCSGKLKEAEALQKQIAVAEWGFAKGGINGTKWIVAKMLGYPEANSHCRRPYPKFSSKEKQDWISAQVKSAEGVERGLVKASRL
ncbi:MAG: hypothetical protein M1834_008439 [Cirrosporium novae-zelandiae]|nr:MAG: hypothetical protein M1834_008439 [Cirrosporium novae-zelandiae]